MKVVPYQRPSFSQQVFHDGHYLATIESGVEAHLMRVARAINLYDRLIELARDAYALADARTNTRPGPCKDTEMLALMVSAKAALEAARKEPR